MVYEKPFWNLNSLGCQFIWLSERDENNSKEWFKNLVGFECLRNHDNILLGWIYGCEEYENLSDEVVQKDCTKILMKFYDRNDIPEPIKLIRYLFINFIKFIITKLQL